MKKIVSILIVCILLLSCTTVSLAENPSTSKPMSILVEHCTVPGCTGDYVITYTYSEWYKTTFARCATNPSLTDRLEWYHVTDAYQCNVCGDFDRYEYYSEYKLFHDHPEA